MPVPQPVILALVVSILCTVFGFGLRAAWRDAVYVFSRPVLLARSLLAVFVVMPVAVVILALVFDFRHDVEVALIALSISPMPPLLPIRIGKAGGDASYGIGLMVALGILAVPLVPVSLTLLSRLSTRPLEMDPGAIAGVIGSMIVTPLLAGMAVRHVFPSAAARMGRVTDLVARILLALGLLALLPSMARPLWAMVGDGTLIAMLTFVAIGLTVGHLLAGPDRADASVLALATACRHPAIAFSIASSNFPGEPMGPPIVLFLLVSLLACVPYLRWQAGRSA